MERTIIGIGGLKNAGKDTFANAVFSNLNMIGYSDVEVVHFADALKDIYEIITGRSRGATQEHKDTVLPEYNMTERQWLQKVGTELFRDQLHPDVWVNALETRYPYDNIIIADVRFDNEVEWIKNNGGVFVYIKTDKEPDGHKSENTSIIDLADFVIENNGTLAEFIQKATDWAVENYWFTKAKQTKLVYQWMRSFNVLNKNKFENFQLYKKLVLEEMTELSEVVDELETSEIDGTGNAEIEEIKKDIMLEAADLVWVAIGAALSVTDVHSLEAALIAITKSNMTKMVSDRHSAEDYAEQNEGFVNYSANTGRYYVTNKAGKIMKGPGYKKFYV